MSVLYLVFDFELSARLCRAFIFLIEECLTLSGHLQVSWARRDGHRVHGDHRDGHDRHRGGQRCGC